MISLARLIEAIQSGAVYMHDNQQPNGGFLSYTSGTMNDFEGAAASPTTFVTALILGALGEDVWSVLKPTTQLEEVRARSARFLLQQCSPNGTFNYWPRDSKAAQALSYPDDLDDTFCSLAALQKYQPALVGAKTLAAAVGQLTRCESEVGGPYYTWVVPPDVPDIWRDVDLGVNCNIAYFLSLQDVHLPQLTALVEAAIGQGEYTTPYYATSPYLVMYFMSRFYRGGLAGKLCSDILERRDASGWWGHPLDSALAVSALLNIGAGTAIVEPAVTRLLETQTDGSWPARALYIERSNAAGTAYAGARTVTTALVLEALTKYGAAQAVSGGPPRESLWYSELSELASNMHDEVVARVRTRFEVLEGDLRDQAYLALNRQLERDRDHQIVLLPYVWEMALKPSLSRATPGEVMALGAANLYGWICYTIYDDFLDEEGVLPQLSVGHVAMRELTMIFESLQPVNPTIGAMVMEIMTGIDAANTWEVVHCRARVENETLTLSHIPDYGDFERLAERSLGHALGPLCLLLVRGRALDTPAVVLTREFFRHYLIARQLNDDAHDWEEDMLRGQINAVGALLLGSMVEKGAGLDHRPLLQLIALMKRQLWQHTITQICDHILRHAGQARQALRGNPELRDTDRLAALLDPLEQSAHEALQERAKVLDFMEAYGDSADGEAS